MYMTPGGMGATDVAVNVPGLERGWNYIHVLLGGAKYHTCKTKLRAVSCLEASCIIFYSESINLASQTNFRKRGNQLNSVHKPCSATPLVLSNHGTVSCHMTNYITV